MYWGKGSIVSYTGMWRRVCQSRRFEGSRLQNVGKYTPRVISFIPDDTQLQQRHRENLTLHASARSVEIWLRVGLDTQSWSGSKAPSNG